MKNNPMAESLHQVVNKLCIDHIYDNIHTAVLGSVISFDAKKQWAKVKVELDLGQTTPIVLVDVPVVFPSGGGYSITFPLKEGDKGQVVFNERCIDNAMAENSMEVKQDKRWFDLSDGVFIAGISTLRKPIKEYAKDATEWRDEDKKQVIRIKKEGIDIESEGTIYLKASKIVVEGAVEMQEATMGKAVMTEATMGKTSMEEATIGGVAFGTHRHGGVQQGEANSYTSVPSN